MKYFFTILSLAILIVVNIMFHLQVTDLQHRNQALTETLNSTRQDLRQEVTGCEAYVQEHQWSVQPKCGVGHMAVWGENEWDCIGKRVRK